MTDPCTNQHAHGAPSSGAPSSGAPSSGVTPPRGERRRVRLVGTCTFACVLGLLIWAKLRIVTTIPRTVIAEPTHVQGAEPSDQTVLPPHPAESASKNQDHAGADVDSGHPAP